ncbi:hypothetical protein [Paraburkholderia atlantica]|uniref:hypothetical protein n=1 Tax=Paraburkholderia atlantica TaxID=2654982 RepID=UPI0016149600|nr:hypothetical protein [Paraburkholderia atlantica]MBB5509043.1 hypothetical protein [Paraburkholderia atlantica]
MSGLLKQGGRQPLSLEYLGLSLKSGRSDALRRFQTGAPMTLLTMEESALALADRHIVEALQRIALQEKRVHDQQKYGRDSSQSEKLLCIMRDILCSFTEHRRQIEEELERERRLPKPLGP